jgi:hypothetical protein
MERSNPERNKSVRNEILGFYAPIGIGLLMIFSALDLPPDTSIPATIGILSALALERSNGR